MDPLHPDVEDRRAVVERIFYEMGWDDVEGIEEWDGDDLESLREILSDDEFQMLMDRLKDVDLTAGEM